MVTERATKKQQELLEYVRGFLTEHDYAPSYREIMTALGYKSVSTVAAHVEGLIAKGYLVRKDNSPRSLDIAKQRQSAVADATAGAATDTIETVEAALRQKIEELTASGMNEDVEILHKALVILGYEEAGV